MMYDLVTKILEAIYCADSEESRDNIEAAFIVHSYSDDETTRNLANEICDHMNIPRRHNRSVIENIIDKHNENKNNPTT